MEDKDKTKKQLVDELIKLRKQVIKLEKSGSDRHNVEEKQKNTEERSKISPEFLPDGYLSVDLKGKITDCNSTFLNLTGYSREDIVNKHFTKLPTLRLKDIPRYIKIFSSAIRGKLPKSFEFKWIHKDETTRWGESFLGITRKKRKISGFNAVIRDITERKQAEEALKKAHNQLEQRVKERTTDLESANLALQCEIDERIQVEEALQESELMLQNSQKIGRIGSFEMDLKTGSVKWSDQLFDVFGLERTKDPIDNEQVLALIHPDDREYAIKVSSEAAMKGEAYELEHRVIYPSGDIHNLLVIGDVVRNDKNENVKIAGTIQDITERKKAEEMLHKAKEAAEVASQAKSNFLASMSHELRTPLNAIIGFSELLQEKYFGALSEKQEEYVKDILESGKYLLDLISDLLDLSKIESGKMKLELSMVNLKELLEKSLVIIKGRALKHKISLDLRFQKDVESLEITADDRRLKQIIFNLLSNAVKFTPDEGAIAVEAKREGKELIIIVSDTGIGIAQEALEKIFEEFYRVSSGENDIPAGTGLGLSITKRLVEMHGGRIWAESEVEKGTAVHFTIPLKSKGKEA